MAAACKAVCVVVSETGNNVLGHLTLTQSDDQVHITGTLSGLTPGKHGLSVCVSGDLSQGAASCGVVFNPFGTSVCAETEMMSGSLLSTLRCFTHTGSLFARRNIYTLLYPQIGKTHGAPEDENRMVGDLGNCLADEKGNVAVDITDKLVQLVGPHSVLGRSIVVYAGEDDQGRGGHENSVTTGNPGPRIAAGVIGLSVQ